MTLWEEERGRAPSPRRGCTKARVLSGIKVGPRERSSPRMGLQVQAGGRASGDCLTFKAEMGKRLVSDSSVLVPVLINFEGLGASLSAWERSRADVYFPLFPFKDNFIKSLCFHSGLNMGHLNGKVIISPCLLMERGESGEGGREASERKRLAASAGTLMCARAHTLTLRPASVSTVPSHWRTLCTHRETCSVHTLPNVGTSLPASTHPRSPEDTILHHSHTYRQTLSQHKHGTLCSQCRHSHRYPQTPLPSMRTHTHTHHIQLLWSLLSFISTNTHRFRHTVLILKHTSAP